MILDVNHVCMQDKINGFEIKFDGKSEEIINVLANNHIYKPYAIEILKKLDIVVSYMEIDSKRQDSLWYGGAILTITFQSDDYSICAVLLAKGETRLTYINGKNKHEFLDKKNEGNFYQEFAPIIQSDNELYEHIRNGIIQLEENNWFEVEFYLEGGDYVEPILLDCPDSLVDVDNVTDAIFQINNMYKTLNPLMEEACMIS